VEIAGYSGTRGGCSSDAGGTETLEDIRSAEVLSQAGEMTSWIRLPKAINLDHRMMGEMLQKIK